ncbi:hypothetical protein PV326_004075, partial [Microctonus aethiopoides]
MGSDVMGFPTDVRGDNYSVLATQSEHNTQGRALQRIGTSDPIKGEHSGEIWESEKSSPSTIKRTNQQVTAKLSCCGSRSCERCLKYLPTINLEHLSIFVGLPSLSIDKKMVKHAEK